MLNVKICYFSSDLCLFHLAISFANVNVLWFFYMKYLDVLACIQISKTHNKC